MTLDQYHLEWHTDAALHLDTLDVDARNVPLLHAKWWRYYTTERLSFKQLDRDYKILYRQKWEWLLGKLDDTEREGLHWDPQPLKILSTNVGIYLDADPLLQQQAAARFLVEETLRFLESVIANINKRGFDIKNTIDFLKFSQGV